MLTSKQRAFLKGLAQKEPVIVQIGKLGINDNVIAQLNSALKARELVKIGVLDSAMMTAAEAAEELASRTSAQVVQVIGNRSVLYRRNPHDPKIDIGGEKKDNAHTVKLRRIKKKAEEEKLAAKKKAEREEKRKRYYSSAGKKTSFRGGEKRYEKRIRGKK